MKALLVSLTLSLLVVACGRGAPAPEPLVVRDAFTNPLPPGQNIAAVYLRLENHSGAAQAINFLDSPLAEHVEVHRHFHENGLMQMRAVQHVRLDAGASLNFAPGGYHLMLFGVESLPAIGESFELTIEFDSGLRVTAPVRVQKRS